MATRLYVGNLPYSITDDDLRQLFSQAGTVTSVDLPTDKYSGRPRGFAFVDMGSSAEAEEAVRKFDGYSLENRTLRVEVAKERTERAPGFRSSMGGRGMGYGGGGRREGPRSQSRRGRGYAA